MAGRNAALNRKERRRGLQEAWNNSKLSLFVNGKITEEMKREIYSENYILKLFAKFNNDLLVNRGSIYLDGISQKWKLSNLRSTGNNDLHSATYDMLKSTFNVFLIQNIDLPQCRIEIDFQTNLTSHILTIAYEDND